VAKNASLQEPGTAAPPETLTRRMAIRRIAAGLAGAGMVVVAGVVFAREPPQYGDAGNLPYSDAIPSQPPPDPSGPRYGDAVKPPAGDKAAHK